MRSISLAEAKSNLPGFDNLPSIHCSANIDGMRKLYGWKAGCQFKIGKQIYNFSRSNLLAQARRLAK